MRSAYKVYRVLAAALMVVLGVLQAWDSGAFAAPGAVLLQILAALVLPPGAALLSRRGGVWGAAVAVSALLLVFARALSPRPLSALLTLVLAAGDLVACRLAAGSTQVWPLVVAPLVMVASIVGAGLVLRPLGGRRVVRIAVFLAVTTLAAAALLAERHPGRLREFVPVLGSSAGGAVVVLTSAARRRSRGFC